MRFRRIDRFLLLLAFLFGLAVVLRKDLPGEEVLPDLYRATVHRPLLAQVAAAGAAQDMELAALRTEVAAAREEVKKLKTQIERSEELNRYLDRVAWEAKPKAIPGWVFAVDSNPYRRAFLIDCGTNQHVGPKMPVVTGHALLGIVSDSGKRVSTVQRVDDVEFRIEVEIRPAEGDPVVGIASGDGNGGLEVRFVRQAGRLKPGDAVFTTRYHEAIPPGLVVGWVEGTEDLDQDGVSDVAVKAAAAIGRWAQIAVLKLRKRG